MYDYQARPQVAYLDRATPEEIETIGPWTRDMYREIGIDLDGPNWQEELERAKERLDA